MRSVSRQGSRLAVLAACGALLAGVGVGCSTTQEKAARHQAEAKRILDARAKRQRQDHVDGPQKRLYGGKSARRHEEEK